MTALMEGVDDRFAGIDIDSLLNGQRRPLSFERKKALYEAPEFIQRLSGEETVMEGQSLCIECKIRGFPVPSLRWFKDDEEIFDHPRIHIESNGIGGYFLIIDNVTRRDEAAYRCRAENLEGACSSFFFLSVKGKPKNPQNRDPMSSSWRTVSYPPMFSTIVEKVEEEEKQGKEFEELPPSPLTEFYYALTLKSRCVWPTFLGDWAFVSNRHPPRKHQAVDDGDENTTDDDNNLVNEDDEEEDDEIIYDQLYIPEGDICDKLKPHISKKAHLAAKRSSRRDKLAAKAKTKKQRLDEDEMKIKDLRGEGKTRDKDKENKLEGNMEKNDDQIRKVDRRKINEDVKLGKTETEDRFDIERATKEEYENMKEKEITDVNRNFDKKVIDVERLWDEIQSREERVKEAERTKELRGSQDSNCKGTERINQAEDNNRSSGQEIKPDGYTRIKEEFRKNKEELEESLPDKETHNRLLVQPNKIDNKKILREDTTTEMGIIQKDKQEKVKQNYASFNTDQQLNAKDLGKQKPASQSERKPNQANEPEVERLNCKTGQNTPQNENKNWDSRLDLKNGTAPMPESLHIFKSNANEIPNASQQHGLNLFVDAKYRQKEISPTRYNGASNEKNTRREDKYTQLGDKKNDNSNNEWSSMGDSYITFRNRNVPKISVEAEFTNARLRPGQQKKNHVESQAKCQDRLEELRQQEVKRMDELRQQELKRMEELRQEGERAASGLYKRGHIRREDTRASEQKQIEELRRKELLQREELRQKEQMQREELRRREEKQKEELKMNGELRSETLTIQEREEREASITKQREELRLKEQSQTDELRLKEIQHSEEFKFKELLQMEGLKAYERQQIDDLKLKEEKNFGESRLTRQIEYGDLQRENEEEKRERERELRIQHKKEQLRKEQLRRQYEEMQKHGKKEDESKRQGIQAARLNEYKEFQAKIHKRRFPVDEHNISNSRKTVYSFSSSNKENESSLKSRIHNKDDSELLIMKRQESLTNHRESFTNSLDRSKKRASENWKQQKDEEFLKRPSSITDKHPQFMETINSYSDSRRDDAITGRRATQIKIQPLSTNSPIAYGGDDPCSNSSTNYNLHKSWSFASFFAMDESRESKPAFRTHEDLCKLAESIAARRELFHESLSQNSIADNIASEKTQKTTNLLGGEIYRKNEIPVHKRAAGLSDDTGKSEAVPSRDETDQPEAQKVQDLRKNEESSLSLMKNDQRERATLDSSKTEVRPFLCTSARTIARRFYKKE